MKLKNFLQLLGLKSKPQHYGYTIKDQEIGGGEVVHYAQWDHPKEVQKVVTREVIEGYGRYIKEGDFCIDIGAQTGDTTVAMGIAAGKSGCVLGLEPNPYVYHVLEKNARGNRHVANILTLQAAASTEQGFMEFEYSDSGFCNGGRHEGISVMAHGHAFKLSVFAVNLDKELRENYAELLPKLSFLKVDAEGFDLYVLQSLAGIIKEFKPVIKAEVFKGTSEEYRMGLLSLMSEVGYTAHKVVSEPADPGEELTRENLAVGTHYDIVCVPKEDLTG